MPIRAINIALILGTFAMGLAAGEYFVFSPARYQIAAPASAAFVWRVETATGRISQCFASGEMTPTCRPWGGDAPFAVSQSSSAQQKSPKAASMSDNGKAASDSGADIMKRLKQFDEAYPRKATNAAGGQ